MDERSAGRAGPRSSRGPEAVVACERAAYVVGPESLTIVSSEVTVGKVQNFPLRFALRELDGPGDKGALWGGVRGSSYSARPARRQPAVRVSFPVPMGCRTAQVARTRVNLHLLGLRPPYRVFFTASTSRWLLPLTSPPEPRPLSRPIGNQLNRRRFSPAAGMRALLRPLAQSISWARGAGLGEGWRPRQTRRRHPR